jgi:hypothetical protein
MPARPFLTNALVSVDVSDAISTRHEKQLGDSDSRNPTEPVAPSACDICGAARTRSERQRLVWDTGSGTELILAELCRHCATRPEALLETYGARSRGALRVTRADLVSEPETAPARAISGIVLRGIVYVLVALAAFVVVTTLTARG